MTYHIVDDLLIRQANNAVEEANGHELTVMEDGVCGRVAFSAGMGSAIVREW